MQLYSLIVCPPSLSWQSIAIFFFLYVMCTYSGPRHKSTISGNEAADTITKNAATSSLPINEIPFSMTELHSQLSSTIWSGGRTAARGQQCLSRHKPLVQPWAWLETQSRYCESLFARFRFCLVPLSKSLFNIRLVDSHDSLYCSADRTLPLLFSALITMLLDVEFISPTLLFFSVAHLKTMGQLLSYSSF